MNRGAALALRTSPTRHPRLAWVALSGAVALSLTACGSSGSSAGSSDEVTIGVISTTSGPFAAIGNDIVNGIKLGVEQAVADGLAKDIEINVEVKDDKADATVASQAARDYISNDTMLLAGMFLATACSAVGDLVDQAGANLLISTCSSDGLSGYVTGEVPYERAFAISQRDHQYGTALAEVVAQEMPEVTDYSVLGFDYSWGHEVWEVFKATANGSGVPVKSTQEHWVPLGTTAYNTQVSAMSRGLGAKEKSGIFLATYGAGTAGFIKQAEALDLLGRTSALLNPGGYDIIAPTLNGKAPDMWSSYDYHHAAYDTEANKSFVEAYQEQHDKLPPTYAYQGYLTGYAYVSAIDEAGSGDPDEVLEALSGLTLEGPAGEVTLDSKTHQLMGPSVVAHTVGDPAAEEGVKVIETTVVPVDDLAPSRN